VSAASLLSYLLQGILEAFGLGRQLYGLGCQLLSVIHVYLGCKIEPCEIVVSLGRPGFLYGCTVRFLRERVVLLLKIDIAHIEVSERQLFRCLFVFLESGVQFSPLFVAHPEIHVFFRCKRIMENGDPRKGAAGQRQGSDDEDEGLKTRDQ
jgi:hypothetical protein